MLGRVGQQVAGRAMRGYTFFFRRGEGPLPISFEFGQYADDDVAMRAAQDLLSFHPIAETIEIFNGERVIGVALRPVDGPGGSLSFPLAGPPS